MQDAVIMYGPEARGISEMEENLFTIEATEVAELQEYVANLHATIGRLHKENALLKARWDARLRRTRNASVAPASWGGMA